jgi:GMP synthase (glutamine-hydrolysing)
MGGKVAPSNKREYGRANLKNVFNHDDIFAHVTNHSQVWMSHGDTITELPEQFELLAATSSIEVAAYRAKKDAFKNPVFALQFHPEVTHSIPGKQILSNFILNICKINPDWTPAHFIDSTVADLKDKLRGKKVICGLSGGVDSTVAATLIHKAIGSDLYCIFVDNGLLRKDEFGQV